MGPIVSPSAPGRQRRHTVQIGICRDWRFVHSESETSDRKRAAASWLEVDGARTAPASDGLVAREVLLCSIRMRALDAVGGL